MSACDPIRASYVLSICMRVVWICLLALVGCAGSRADDADPASCVTLSGSRRVCGAKSVRVPLISSDGSARVAASVDGQAIELLLDTGAESTVLSSTLLGSADQVVTRVSELCIGELCLENEEVYAWETIFSTASGPGPAGFVGMRTLREFGFELDSGAYAGLSLGQPSCAGTATPLAMNEYGIPSVEVTPHTLPTSSMTIDTGATYTLLSQASVDGLDPASLEPQAPAPLCTVNGCQDGVAFTASLPSYCVGVTCESNLGVKFPAFDAVGMTFFARRRVLFDFADALLWFCD